MIHKATCRSFWSGRESACDCKIDSPQNGRQHCQQCGSTDYEDVNLGDQGYSACCNEIVMVWCDRDACYHLEEN